MKAIPGGGKSATRTPGKKSPNMLQRQRKSVLQRQRNGLLAVVHIAKQQLGLDDAAYRDVLKFYGVSSSAAMSIAELEDLVGYFESRGFKKKVSDPGGGAGRQRMVEALQDRIREEAASLENGESRLSGIVKRVANVDDLRFCRNVAKLKQILKIIGLYRKKEMEDLP